MIFLVELAACPKHLSIVQVRVGSFLERRYLHTLLICGAANLECPSSHPHPTTTSIPLRIWRSSYTICIRCTHCLKLSLSHNYANSVIPHGALFRGTGPPTFQQKKSDTPLDTCISFIGQHNWLHTSSARLSTSSRNVPQDMYAILLSLYAASYGVLART